MVSCCASTKKKKKCKNKSAYTCNNLKFCKLHYQKNKENCTLHKYLIYNKKESCSICLDVLQNNILILPCEHVFHKICINKWIINNKNNCPICRKVVSITPPNRNSQINVLHNYFPVIRNAPLQRTVQVQSRYTPRALNREF